MVFTDSFLDSSAAGSSLSGLRALRVLRALRPLRMASRNEGMRVVVTAVFKSVPPLGNVVLVGALFYLIYAILGVNLMAGLFHACYDSGTGERCAPVVSSLPLSPPRHPPPLLSERARPPALV